LLEEEANAIVFFFQVFVSYLPPPPSYKPLTYFPYILLCGCCNKFTNSVAVMKKKTTATHRCLLLWSWCCREEKGDGSYHCLFFYGFYCRKEEEGDNSGCLLFLGGCYREKKAMATTIVVAFF
jgi:hypothetical protein